MSSKFLDGKKELHQNKNAVNVEDKATFKNITTYNDKEYDIFSLRRKLYWC